MDYMKALVIKFIAIAVSTFAIFGVFYDANWLDLFWISLIVTGISFVLGDLIILRMLGNIPATISDYGLAFVSLLFFGSLFLGNDIPIVTLSLLTAFFITCCEPFIHGYLVNQFSPESYEREDLRTQNQLQTEAAEEMDAGSIIKDIDNAKK